LINPKGVIWVITFTNSVQVSGFGCQHGSRLSGSNLLMKYAFLHLCWPSGATQSMLRIQDSILTDT
jgi:hypothetical protein